MVSAIGYTLFDTEVGRCALAWGAGGVIACQLPERDDAATVARLRRRATGAVEAAPTPKVRALVERLRASLGGASDDFSNATLDWTGVAAFEARVLRAALAIPYGATWTYGDLAKALGEPGAARAVGAALGRNPFAPIVPCHRVLAADGAMHGFSAHGGTGLKARLLRIEGALKQPDLFEA